MKAKALIVGASPFQVPLIQRLNALGYDTVSISNRPHDPGLKIASKGLLLNILDFDQVGRLYESEQIDFAVTCASDIATLTVAHLNEKFHRTGLTGEQVLHVTHKGRFNTLLHELSLNHVHFEVITDETDLDQAVLKIPQFPVILKPVFSSGSRGIVIAYSQEDILTNHERVLSLSLRHRAYVMQQFINGTEIGGECLIENGRVVFLEFTHKMNNHWMVPIGHFVSNPVNERIKANVKKQLEAIAGHLDLKNTAVNIDTIVDHNEIPYIIDLSLRLGGNLLPDLMHLKHGFDPYQRVIDYALNRPIDPLQCVSKDDSFGVLIFHSDEQGVMTSQIMNGIGNLIAKYETLEMIFDIQTGEVFEPFTEGSKRFGHALCTFDSIEAYKMLLRGYSGLMGTGKSL